MAETHRATVAELDKKLDRLILQVDHIKENIEGALATQEKRLERHSQNLDKLNDCMAHKEEKVAELRKDVDKVEARVTAWNGINSIGVIAASILGVFWGDR